MSDDIDIEEHDILDNPRIKNMFLDISNIKTELDYDEENIEIKKENFDPYQAVKIAVKSEATSLISSTETFEQDLTNDKVFPDEIRPKPACKLAKFKCEICNSIFNTKTAFKIHKNTHKNYYYVCKICSCHFFHRTRYTSHVYIKHGVKSIKKYKPCPADHECSFCPTTLCGNSNYNNHILAFHPEMCNKVIDEDFEEYESRASNLNDNLSSKVLKPKLVRKTDIYFYIPISTLFECNKCKTHFISGSVAIEHEKRCDSKKSDWKCKHCLRSFKESDKLLICHLQQHKLTNEFKTITVESDIHYRLLYKCTDCSVCCNEKDLLKYHAKGCPDTSLNWIFCIECKVLIHKNAYKDHRRIHSKFEFKFIIVDIVCAEQKNNKNLVKKIRDETVVDYSPLSMHEKTFFYCNICQYYKKLDVGHDGRKCSRKSGIFLCELCGLRFSSIVFNSHMKTHQKFHNLKLQNLIFFDIHTKKKINPPFPNFKKCTSCSVHFFTNITLKNHICKCSAKEAKICRYCRKKFTDLTYKLHVPFHEYMDIHSEKIEEIKMEEEIQNIKRPEIIKKYGRLKPISNILFLCETCDMVLDCYDDVVEHCQDHFTNMESYNVTINPCSICDLKFAGNCYEKHKKLHATSSVNRSAFKILVYNYENLLSDSWTDIFNSLSKDQVDQILNKSKYKYTRSVRIKDETDTR